MSEQDFDALHLSAVSKRMRLCVWTGIKGIDNQIAATALAHNLLVLTRSVKDFENAGMHVFDRLRGLKTDAVTDVSAANLTTWQHE